MRAFVLSLVVAVSLAACAPPPGAAVAAPLDPVLQARADSLQALPPDSLSAADTDWLQEYARQRAPENATPRRSPVADAIVGTAFGIVVAAMLTIYLAVESIRIQ